MPYEWISAESGEAGQVTLRLWPYRSLPRQGFVAFIAITAAMLVLPLMAVLGTPVLWGLLPFIAAAVAGVWWALSGSYRAGGTVEVLRFDPDCVTLTRRAPDGTERRWQANPYWVRVRLYPTGGPVPDYLTLRGNGREVEIGAFLAPPERRALKPAIEERLRASR